MKWKKTYADLLAPYHERLLELFERDPATLTEKEEAFINAVKARDTSRPLQAAWVALYDLSEEARIQVIAGFKKGSIEERKKRSARAIAAMTDQGIPSQKIDYYQEMLSQGIVPTRARFDEPLGTREDFTKDRARNKYNGR